jgi:hypothetical protein
MRHVSKLKKKTEKGDFLMKKLCLCVLLAVVSIGAVKLLAGGPPPPPPGPDPSTNSVPIAPNQSFN